MIISSGEILDASILIVDDQQANVALLGQLLSEAGYRRVASTMDPREVCALHRKNHYDLILLDLQMPGMDGFEVMEGLKTNAADAYLPVLVITAQPGHKLRALQAGAKDFVSKPFDLVGVENTIGAGVGDLTFFAVFVLALDGAEFDHGRRLLTLAHMAPKLLGLLEGHPTF